jgi:DNA-binding GntR family transcriptional regulator
LAAVSSPNSPRPLKVESTYHLLKRLIVTLELPPGAPLEERELMDRYSVGRTPLREAMFKLSHERLVVHSPRRGVRVSDLSILDLQEMIEARSSIEPLVTRRAATRVTSADLANLARILSDAEAAIEAGDIETTVNLDVRFHAVIAWANDNRYFASMAEQMDTAMLRYWYISYTRKNGVPTSFAHHHALFDALAQGDPDLAERRSLEHIDIFKSRMRDLVF